MSKRTRRNNPGRDKVRARITAKQERALAFLHRGTEVVIDVPTKHGW